MEGGVMPFTIENATCLREADSGKAILVEAKFFDDGVEWIPVSQIDDNSEVYKKNTEGDLIVSNWLARKKGWED
jgi:hypothetical protein